MSFADNLFGYVQDINSFLNGVAGNASINTIPQVAVDSRTSASFGTLTAARKPFKPFIIGFIPPDALVNYIPIDVINKNIADVTGSTVQDQSASAGAGSSTFDLNLAALRPSSNSPNEMQPARTPFTQKDLGDAMYQSLKTAGVPDTDAARLVPLMVGNINAENSSNTCKNYNLGNLQTGKSGQYNDPSDPNSGFAVPPVPPNGGIFVLGTNFYGPNQKLPDGVKVNDAYPTYYQASLTLQDATNKWVVQTVKNWPGVLNASSPQDYAQALLSTSQGGSGRGPYYTADPRVYTNLITVGQSAYLRATGGIVTPSNSDTVANATSDDSKLSVGVMASGDITDIDATDPLSFVAGRNIRATTDQDRARVVSLQTAQVNAQIRAIQQTPPLSMLINPQEFTRSYEHSFDAPKARRGHIVHTWLEKPMVINCKGQTAGSYVFDSTSGAGGLTNRYRCRALSYRNLMSLVRIYKNNGYIYTGNAFGDMNGNMPLIAMSVYIYFDSHLYIGSFDSFSISDEADHPFSFSYSFSFNVRYDIQLTVNDSQLVGLATS
jgi:hypothetical protein